MATSQTLHLFSKPMSTTKFDVGPILKSSRELPVVKVADVLNALIYVFADDPNALIYVFTICLDLYRCP